MQANAVSGDCWIALILDGFAADQGDAAQRGEGCVKSLAGQLPGKWLPECRGALTEQEQRDGLGGQACRVTQ